MLGAIVGDICGSRFEWHNHKSKSFSLFTPYCHVTDDSIMSLAVAEAILRTKKDDSDLAENTVRCMQWLGRKYPRAGYGEHFCKWLLSDSPKPYNSYGNGAAMRVSACGWAADSLEEAKKLSATVTGVTHNHPEGYKAAEAVAAAIFLARQGSTKDEIREHIRQNYYPQEFTLDSVRDDYFFDVTCQGSVPHAFEAFYESENFEDAIRNAISVGGDSDTIGAITGSIAEAYYGIPASIRKQAINYLDDTLFGTVNEFEALYGFKAERN